MGTHREIADAVVTELIGRLGLPALRAYLPSLQRKEAATLHVTVVPSPRKAAMIGRSLVSGEYAVDIAVQQEVDPQVLAESDVLFDLVETIEATLRPSGASGGKLIQIAAARWSESETVSGAEAGYAHEHLKNQNMFTGVVRVKYRVIE